MIRINEYGIPSGPCDEVYAVYDAILAIDLDAIQPRSTDRMYLSDRTKAIRGLLKELDLKGISCRTPRYALASMVDVNLPQPQPCSDAVWNESWHRRRVAAEHLESIILRAYPGFVDRSDSQTDYFDACFMID